MEAAKSQLKRVLVVCTGNTCRSPMAAGWLNQKLAGKGWVAESAGVAAWDGSPATPEANEAMREVGIDISRHRSRTLTQALIQAADIVLTMTAGHQREIFRRYPEAGKKTFLVKGFGLEPAGNVADPIGFPVEVYRHTREEIVQALGEFLLHLAEDGELRR